MKKHPFCGAHFSINIWNVLNKWAHYTHPPFKNVVQYFSCIEYCMSNVYHSFFRFFGLVPMDQMFYLLIELSQFRLISVFPQKPRANFYHIIIYTMNNHHWGCTFVLTFYKSLLIIFLQTPYLSIESILSWVKIAIVELVGSSRDKCPLQQTKHILKVVRSILI